MTCSHRFEAKLLLPQGKYDHWRHNDSPLLALALRMAKGKHNSARPERPDDFEKSCWLQGILNNLFTNSCPKSICSVLFKLLSLPLALLGALQKQAALPEAYDESFAPRRVQHAGTAELGLATGTPELGKRESTAADHPHGSP